MSTMVYLGKDLGRVDYSKLNGHHIDKLKNYLSKQKNDKQLLNKIFRPSSDTTLLYHAVNHDANFAAYLIQFAIENDVDSRSLLGSGNHLEVLHAAIEKRNYELVEMFLKHSVNQRRYTSLFDVDTFYDPTPFQIAINMKDIRSMNTIFRFSVENGVGAVKLLGLTKGEQSALHYAIHKRSCLDVMRAIVSLARDNGVDVALLFRAWCSGMTALRSASRVNSKMVNCVIELAKECGICAKKLTGPDSDGNTPLHYAAMESDEDSVEAIWNFATDSGVVVASLFQSYSNETPLHFAASNVSHNTFDTVLWRAKNNGVPLDLLLQKDSYGKTPLHLLAQNHTATTEKYEKAVKDILRLAHQGSQLAAILKRDKHGQTPLDYAACRSNEGIARAILQSVAQLDQEMVHVLLQPDTCGKTPLHLAAQEKKDRAAIEIMQAAAGSGRETVKTILAPDKSGRTPLGLALSYTGMQFGDFGFKITTGKAIMRFALENGVDWRTLIDIKDAALRLKLKEIFYEQIICDSRIWPRLYPSQSSVALSASTRSRTNERSNLSQLQDEILVIIFEYLDALDLNNCEMVCLRWRNILSSKIIWRKLHSRMSKHCETYRRFQKIVELEDEQFLHYESSKKCKIISRKLQELDTNWRTGNYKMKIRSWNKDLHVRFKSDDDYLLFHTTYMNRFRIINRRPRAYDRVRELDSRFNDVSDFQIHGNNIVVASDEFIRVFNATTLKEVNDLVVPNHWKIVNLCFEHGLLVALSESSPDLPKSRQLTVWRVNSSTDIQHLDDVSVAGDEGQKRTTNVAMDRRYIAVFLETQASTKIYFVCTETWTILERSLTITATDGRILHYHPGLLITQKDNYIRLKDVLAGDCREINLEPFGLSSESTQIRTNSNYLVVMNGQAEWTKVGIFRITSGCDTPLCCFDIPMAVKWFEMYETELICVGVIHKFHEDVVMIDFLPTPPIKEFRRTAWSESLSSGDAPAWRFTLAKEIYETLISSNDV